MDLGLRNKVVLVAGASEGLGFAIAKAFAHEGAKVAICSRDLNKINKAAELIQNETQADIMASVVDLTHPEEINNWVLDVAKKWNTIHICITNTGGPPSSTFIDTTDEQWYNAINLTLMSAVRLSHAVIPFMKKQKWGRIIHICSASVKNPIPNLIFSNSIRAAVVALGKTQSNELGIDGILVNSVLPGWTRTERTNVIMQARAKASNRSIEESYQDRETVIPVKRIATPDEIASPVVFLASEKASFITGIALTVDGGETKVPF